AEEMVEIAIKEAPEWICLVPEKREERTTEGGLDVIDPVNYEHVKKSCEKLKRHLPQTKISLFVESDLKVLSRCLTIKADAVEIHTGEYAKDFISGKDLSLHLVKYQAAASLIKNAGRGF